MQTTGKRFEFAVILVFLLLDPEKVAQKLVGRLDQPSSTPHINVRFRFSRKILKIPIHIFTQARNTGRWLATCSPELTSSATSDRLEIAFMPPLQSATSPSQSDLFRKSRRLLTKAGNFNIYYGVKPESLLISTENDVFSHFRSAANRINVFTLDHVWVAFSG